MYEYLYQLFFSFAICSNARNNLWQINSPGKLKAIDKWLQKCDIFVLARFIDVKIICWNSCLAFEAQQRTTAGKFDGCPGIFVSCYIIVGHIYVRLTELPYILYQRWPPFAQFLYDSFGSLYFILQREIQGKGTLVNKNVKQNCKGSFMHF